MSPVVGRRAQYAGCPDSLTPADPRVAQSAPIRTTGTVGVLGDAGAGALVRCAEPTAKATATATPMSAATATAGTSQRGRPRPPPGGACRTLGAANVASDALASRDPGSRFLASASANSLQDP